MKTGRSICAWKGSPVANAWDLIEQYESERPGDPQWAWQRARFDRTRGDTSQELADAEHHLWAKYNASKGLPQAIIGMGGPLVHHGVKKAYEFFGIPDASAPTEQQLQMGNMGAWAGLKRQLSRTGALSEALKQR